MRRLVGAVGGLALSANLFVACAGGIANQELMASLPTYPGSTLVQTYATADITGPFLWHIYAASEESETIRTFYRAKLGELGWQLDFSKDSVMLTFHKNGDEVDLFLFDMQLPQPDVKVTQVSAPPPDTETFFGIRVANR